MTCRKAVFLTVALLVGGCDGGPSAVETRPRDQAASVTEEAAESPGGRAAAPDYKGRPLWSATRRLSAEENARRAFERNGAGVGAETLESYVEAAHRFVRSPPRGTLSMTRENGDVLLYSPDRNLFAVVTREGAPRTLFRPEDGADYWRRQIDREVLRPSREEGRSEQG
jgi:pyocin large subunit-like protein